MPTSSPRRRSRRGFSVVLLIGLFLGAQCGCARAPSDAEHQPIASTSGAITSCAPVCTVTQVPGAILHSCACQCGGASCNLDATLAAATGGNSIHHVVLEDGDYEVTQPITHNIVMEAKTQAAPAPNGSVTPWGDGSGNCIPSLASLALPITSAVRVHTNTGAIVVNTTLPTDTVILDGLALDTKGRFAAIVRAGKAQIRRAMMNGAMSVDGAGSELLVNDTLVAQGMAPSPFGDARTSDVNDLYLTRVACKEAGISVTNGAHYSASNVEVSGAPSLGVCVSAANATLCNGKIHGTQKSSDSKYGRGAEVVNGGTLTLRGTHVYDNYEAGVLASDANTRLTLSDNAEVDTHKYGTQTETAVAVMSQARASLTIANARIHDNKGVGIFVTSASSGTVSNARIETNRGAGVAVYNADLTLTGSQVTDTGADASLGMGMGMLVLNSSNVTATSSTFARNQYAGVYIQGDGGTLNFSGNVFSENKSISLGTHAAYGNGVFATGRCSGLTLGTNSYTGNQGEHVFLHAAYASLSASSYSMYSPTTVTAFQQQHCTCAGTYAMSAFATLGLPAPDYTVVLCPTYDNLTADLLFHLYVTDPSVKSY